MSYLNTFKTSTNRPVKTQRRRWGTALLATLGLSGLVTGCSQADLVKDNVANAQSLPSPTLTPIPPTATPSPTFTPSPTNTPLPTNTPWPTPTSWSTPITWRPAVKPLPTLAPVPIVPATASGVTAPAGIPGASVPVSYSPPDGVDVFGGTVLRWTYYGQLAPDEFFDIKIRPLGSNDSAFVDWSKTPEYELRPWNGWTPGLYTWQIGIIKGQLEGETKHFIADTGRDSEPFLIKWQAAGGGGGGGGGSSSGGGGGGGGSSSGGS